jgi:uncharacterized protein YjbJ (UPF0337 family)
VPVTPARGFGYVGINPAQRPHGGTRPRAQTLTNTLTTKKDEDAMDKDRIQGSADQAKGKVKEIAGKLTGDTKLESEGKAQKISGKVQNTIGGMKDAVKDAIED